MINEKATCVYEWLLKLICSVVVVFFLLFSWGFCLTKSISTNFMTEVYERQLQTCVALVNADGSDGEEIVEPPVVHTPLPVVNQCSASQSTYQYANQAQHPIPTVLTAASWNTSYYQNSLVLDNEGLIVLYWRLTNDLRNPLVDGVIEFAVEAETKGWVGIGLSPVRNTEKQIHMN